jgi:hypothetical protein
MGKIIDGNQELDAAYEAATRFREAIMERCAEAVAGASGAREMRPEDVTDLTVQALVCESLHRNDGRPVEVLKALCHGLAMIVAQQPDAMATTGEIATRVLQYSALVKADMAKAGIQPEAGTQQ